MKAHERQLWDLYSLLDANIYKNRLRTKNEVEYVTSVLPLKDYEHILDLQCGDGRIAIPLINKGYKVTGLDYDRKALKRLKSKNKSSNLQKIINAPITSLPTIRKIDAIIMIYAVMPVNLQLSTFFGNLAKLIDNNGRIVIDLLPREYVENTGKQKSVLTEKYKSVSAAYRNVYRIRSYIPENQVERSEFFLKTFDGDVKHVVFEHKVFGLGEAIASAEKVGLLVKQINGGLEHSEYVPGISKRLVILMEKEYAS